MGAHSSAPSGLSRNGERTTLDRVIAKDPDGELGKHCVAEFGPRLSFLLKILAPEKAISIQVHPDRAQAQAGFLEENKRGIAVRDRARNFVDDWPKPELLYALTPFEVLAGFRSAEDALGLLSALAVERLRPVVAQLENPDHSAGRMAALQWILDRPEDQREGLVAEVVSACARLAAGGGPYAAACAAVGRIAADHPGDLGIPASLLLSYSVLRPGEALFMAAGGLHAYIKGVGVELLANSDNVIRAGLTMKHVDVPGLISLADPSVAVPILQPRPVSRSVVTYDAPVPEFRLYRIDLMTDITVVPDAGPRIVLCTSGSGRLESRDGTSIQLGRGESAFLPDHDGVVAATGAGVFFVAASGCAPASSG
jgi:mannose-6-phosphate isomerase